MKFIRGDPVNEDLLISGDLGLFCSMQAELQKYFEASSSGEVLQELGSLCRVFGLSGEDLFYKWEAFAMTHPGHSLELTPEHVQDFRKHIETSMKTTGSKVKAEPGDGTTFGTPVVPRTQLRKNIGRNQLDSM